MLSHLLATVPGEWLINFLRHIAVVLGEGVGDRLGILASDLYQRNVARLTVPQGSQADCFSAEQGAHFPEYPGAARLSALAGRSLSDAASMILP